MGCYRRFGVNAFSRMDKGFLSSEGFHLPVDVNDAIYTPVILVLLCDLLSAITAISSWYIAQSDFVGPLKII